MFPQKSDHLFIYQLLSTRSIGEQFLLLLLTQESMGATCGCGKSEFHIPPFHEKNQYVPVKNVGTQADRDRVAKVLAPGYGYGEISGLGLVQFILECPREEFVDVNFKNLEPFEVESNGLYKLYDYKRQKIDRIYSETITPLETLNQKQIAFCYLSSVFYVICQNPKLKQRICITKNVNDHHAYIFDLFCNGAPCQVVVDETIPLQKQQIKYLNLTHTKEIWPYLLEKAWCKQISNYTKSMGLSPEECFEQIIGAPAYSFIFKQNSFYENEKSIKDAMSKNYWVTFTGHITEKGLPSRQVFYLEKIQDDNRSFWIRSPYANYDFTTKEKDATGRVKVELSEVIKYFQFATIGYYIPGYVSTFYHFKSKKNEEVVYELVIKKQQSLNLRFIQFYEQYLQEKEKNLYRYSSVFMELYDQQYNLVESCQGMPEIIGGVRSSNLSKDIFSTLPPSVYYLRLQVNWFNELELNEGNIVIYSEGESVKLKKSEKNTSDLIDSLVAKNLQSPNTKEIKNDTQQIKVRYLQKSYRYVLGIENLRNESSNLKLVFNNSENIRINHYQMSGNTIQVHLESLKEKVLEVLPADPKKPFYLAPFDIVKI